MLSLNLLLMAFPRLLKFHSSRLASTELIHSGTKLLWNTTLFSEKSKLLKYYLFYSFAYNFLQLEEIILTDYIKCQSGTEQFGEPTNTPERHPWTLHQTCYWWCSICLNNTIKSKTLRITSSVFYSHRTRLGSTLCWDDGWSFYWMERENGIYSDKALP